MDSVSQDAMVLEYCGTKFPARKDGYEAKAGDNVMLSLRTERIGFARTPVGDCSLPAVLKSRHYAGGSMRAVLTLEDGREVLALCQSSERAQGEIGERVWLSWNCAEAPVVR